MVLVLDVRERTVGRVSHVPGSNTDDGSDSVPRPNEVVSTAVVSKSIPDHDVLGVVRKADAGARAVSDLV